jgi:photosystem II stability/assembly factor-like uncharacterized protein
MARVDGRARLFAGTEPAYLFFSDDLGGRWTELPALRSVPSVPKWSFPGPPHVAHLKHITFDPRNASTIYASIEVGGLLRSRDGGQTWEELPGMYEDVHRLVVHPTEPRLYVSGGDGLYVSADAGASWEHWTTREHEIGGYPDQLVYQPGRPETMFVAAAKGSPGEWRTSHFAGARVSRSDDGGRTWRVLAGGLPDRLQSNIEAMSIEGRSGGVCSLFAASTAGEVFFSEDSGDTWSLIASGLAPISKGGHFEALVPAHA